MRLSVVLAGSGFPKLRSAVTLIESGGRNVLVDTGLCEDGGKLVAALAGRGIAPEAVDTIITTHLHYDHCGNHLLFPKARFVVGRADYDDTRSFIAHYHADVTPEKRATAELLRSRNTNIKDFYVRSIVREITRNLAFYDALLAGDARFEPIEGRAHLTKNIDIIPTPGHTPGHLSVVVHGVTIGGEQTSVLVGGDAIFSRNGTTLASGESHLAWNPEIYRVTRASLLSHYRWIVPGHDDLVDTRPLQHAVLSGGRECLTASS